MFGSFVAGICGSLPTCLNCDPRSLGQPRIRQYQFERMADLDRIFGRRVSAPARCWRCNPVNSLGLLAISANGSLLGFAAMGYAYRWHDLHARSYGSPHAAIIG